MSDPELVQYIADQLAEAGTVRFRRLFGEYGLYLDGKIFALLCGNTLYIKETEAGKQLLPGLEKGAPFPGARHYFLFEDIDDRERFTELVRVTCRELPPPQPRRPRRKKSSDAPGKKKDR